MKRMLMIVVALAIVGGGAALLVPNTTWGTTGPKEAKLPKDFGAYVMNVSDGRTMAISVSNDLYTLRVKGIKLPDRSDAALESELNLRTLVFGRNILVENSVKAADGVYEGDVRVGPDYVAQAQISAGLASLTVNNSELAGMQETAKTGKLGMWAPPPAPEAASEILAADQSHSSQTP